MPEKKIDNTIKKKVEKKVEKLAKKQEKIAIEILKSKYSPNGLNDVGSYCKEIFVAGTEGQAVHDIKLGSWIAGQFLPLQLLTQRKLMVDLSLRELQKEKPYNMPLNSLIKLVRQGFVYLNIRDFDLLNDEGNEKLFSNTKVVKNLDTILSKVPNYCLYVGSAMRKPLFDKLTYWQGNTSSSYEEKQIEFKGKVKDVEAAYKFYSYKSVNDKFRGEEPSLIAASWHYAYLSAAKSKIAPAIFYGENGDDGIEAQIDKCQMLGSIWSKDKDNFDKQKLAALAFIQLTKCLRSFHLDNTALLTGSWGHIYNRTSDEYRDVINVQAEMLNPGVVNTVAYQNFLYSALQKSGIIGNTISYDSLIDPDKKRITIDESFVDTLVGSLLNKGSQYDEIDEITKELYAVNADNFTKKTYDKLLKEYDGARKNFLSGFDSFFNEHFKVKLSLGTSIINIFPVALELEIAKVSLPEGIKKLFIRNKENFLMYRLHNVITKNQSRK